MVCYSCDFETTSDPDDCRVWAWVIMSIKDYSYIIGNDIDDFIKHCLKLGGEFYFHNLKFDGEFILYYLLSNGYKYTKNRTLKDDEFSALINDTGEFYSIKIKGVEFRDSLKLLPFKVEEIAKKFNFEISKLEIDYNKKREKGYNITEDEEDYIITDAKIVAMALKELFKKGIDKLTIGSSALSYYKKHVDNFKRLFPSENNDSYIRKSYKGGFTYVNPKYKGKEIGKGIVLDVNSLYPYVMYSPHKYPIGEGVYFKGEYEQDKIYPLYFQRIMVEFELKPGYLPTIQIKGSYLFSDVEYLKSSNGELVELCLTMMDLELFLEHYEINEIYYIDGYKYREATGIFDEYIEYWYKQKFESKKNGDSTMYVVSKLMQNSLYGKFASRPEGKSKIPYLEDGIVKYKLGEIEKRKSLYIPIGSFITSYARNKTIRAAQNNIERFAYSDTDSLHLLGWELPELDIDDYKLGYWKLESKFDKAKFIRSKMYMELVNGEWKVTGAGMSKEIKQKVDWDNFEVGASFYGKLRPKHVKGGIILEETTFKIRG